MADKIRRLVENIINVTIKNAIFSGISPLVKNATHFFYNGFYGKSRDQYKMFKIVHYALEENIFFR